MKRRTALGLMASAPLAPGLLASTSAVGASALSLNPQDPDDLYLIHRKINYTYDDQPVFWFIEAVRYGLVDSAFIPFWNMHVGFLFTVHSTGEFDFETKQLSAIFYTDPATGKLLESFDNPLTGEKIPVRQPGLIRSSGHFDKTRHVRELRKVPGSRVTMGTDIGPAWIIGDDVWVHGDTWFRAEPTGDEGRLTQVNDWSTYHGSLTEVADPDVTCAAATMNFNDINTWPSWLNMGDRPGNYVSRGVGRKTNSGAGMPPQWQRIMKDLYPEEFKDLVGAIAG
jgi:hypothetical protein